MSDIRLITLPITGMTCANCSATVERNLKKVNGVQSAAVNLSSERATVEFDPQASTLDDLIGRVQRAGYGVAEGEADLVIKRLSDDNDARRLEKALSALEGVREAQVSYATERAQLRYIPTLVSQTDLRRAISAAGFEALETGGDAEDAEALARQKEIDQQKRHLIIGLIFTVPLFLLAMAGDLGFLPMEISHSAWINWVMLALALPVQFYVGWQYYVGAYKSLRNGSANMDVLIALGSSAAFFYSLPDHPRSVLGPRLLRNRRGDHHPDQAGQVAGSARQGPHQRSDQEADGPARQNRPHRPRRAGDGSPGR